MGGDDDEGSDDEKEMDVAACGGATGEFVCCLLALVVSVLTIIFATPLSAASTDCCARRLTDDELLAAGCLPFEVVADVGAVADAVALMADDVVADEPLPAPASPVALLFPAPDDWLRLPSPKMFIAVELTLAIRFATGAGPPEPELARVMAGVDAEPVELVPPVELVAEAAAAAAELGAAIGNALSLSWTQFVSWPSIDFHWLVACCCTFETVRFTTSFHACGSNRLRSRCSDNTNPFGPMPFDKSWRRSTGNKWWSARNRPPWAGPSATAAAVPAPPASLATTERARAANGTRKRGRLRSSPAWRSSLSLSAPINV